MRVLLALFLVSGCGVPQAKECERFLACSEAITPMSTKTSALTYGPGGTCWDNTTIAATCKDICTKALGELKDGAGASTAACQ